MSWLDKLQTMDFEKGSSQMGEAGIIDFIFKHIPPQGKYCVDIGAGFYGKGEMSNTNDLLLKGWQGLRIDADDSNDVSIKKLYVTPENIVPFLQANNVPFGFDLLSIDIDSFDLDILEKIVPTYQPRVICTEYNGTLDPTKSIKLKYEPGYVWDETNKYGYSFGAGQKFADKYGYKIILNHKNQNLFLVRSDIITESPDIKAKQTTYHPVNKNAQWEDY